VLNLVLLRTVSTEMLNTRYEGIPDTLVQWFRFRISVVIAATYSPRYAGEARMPEEGMETGAGGSKVQLERGA